MRQHFVFFSVLCFFFLQASAQTYNIQGKVLDLDNGGGIEMASIRLLRAADSAFINGVVSDFAGRYSFSKLTAGNYVIEYKYLGYKTCYLDLSVKNKSRLLKNVYMEEDVQMLEEAEVSGTAAQMVVRGDTIEYNASAFKLSENAVVEDLLKRLPGFMIDSDGNITVNGETIARIRIDGKKFFDGDMEMITKNFTADMIDKIQVIDELSEMAQLTGFEDGDTKRIINLTLKPDRKKGTFGNLGGGVGADFDKGIADYTNSQYDWNQFLKDDFRYDANGMVNFFKNNNRTSITAGANNTNTSRSARGRSGRGWSNGSGITATQNIGLNNNMELNNDSLALSGNATYNHSTNQGRSWSKSENWLKDVTNTDTSYSQSNSISNNANLGYEIRWKMDTLNTLVIQPNVSYGLNNTHSERTFEYYTDGDTTSYGNSNNNNSSQDVNARLNILFSHKSGTKKGRTITANISGSYSDTQGEGFNISNKYMRDSSVLLNQKNINNSNSYSLSFKGSYIEPLWDLKNYLELSASVNYANRYSKRDQYDIDNNDAYTLFNAEYSNEFWNTNVSENLSLSYRYYTSNINLTAGFTAEPSQTHSYTLYGDGYVRNITNNVFNYSPTFNMRYNIKGEKRNYIRIEYRGRSTEPTVNQMQPVKDNTNVMRETVGNASLLPSFAHSLKINYTKSNATTLASFSTTLNASMTKDALVSNSIYDASGKQYNQTVNAEQSPYNLNGSIMYNRPIIKNLLHFNTNTSASYQERIGYSSRNVNLTDIDVDNLMLGDRSITQNYSASENLSLTLTQEVVEVGLRGSFRYSNTLNNLNTDIERSTINWSATGNVTLHLPFDINIDNSLSYQARQGYAGFDKNELIWNATIDKPVFKKKFTLAVKAYDILRQRLNINQNIGDNSVSYTQSDMLTSYFIVSLTYRIRQFGGRSGNRGGMSGAGGMRGGDMRGGDMRGGDMGD